jgi:hypothetical protein
MVGCYVQESLSKFWPGFSMLASIASNVVVVWVRWLFTDVRDGSRNCSRCRYADLRDGSRKKTNVDLVSRWFVNVHEKNRQPHLCTHFMAMRNLHNFRDGP